MQVLTILFTDVADSSSIKRNREFGRDDRERDRVYHEKVQTPYESLVRRNCQEHAGQIVKGMGDGFFLSFEDAFEGVRCAIAIQRALASSVIETPVGRLHVRLGLHSGDPLPIEGDLHGTDVDTAARVQAAASRDQILISARTYELVRHMSDTVFHARGEFALKGLPRIHLWEVDWDGAGPKETAIPRVSDHGTEFPVGWKISAVVMTVILGAAGVLWFESHRYHPPTMEVQRWYDIGVAALHEGTYLGATRALQAAVDRDKSFALAHARLADAWSELDFAGRAQSEMLLAAAPEAQRSLPAKDRMYIEAVRATLTRDFAAAAKQYQAILAALPETEKGFGYVDLGRAQQKAGNFDEACKDFEAAIQRDKDDPAAFVRLGVLQNRLQDQVHGEEAFARAETLYWQSSNQEGLAEIAYQRGYAENVRGDSESAKADLQKSLKLAKDIPSVQLEIRALTQLSNVEYADGHASESMQYANQAIALARDNGLDYWSGDGLMRLGNAYLIGHRLAEAEVALQSAMRIAKEQQRPRLEANVMFTLADVRDQQDQWDEAIRFAEAAREYYKSVGMLSNEISASNIIIHGQQNKGDSIAALRSATELLATSKKTANPILMQQGEELVGGVLNDLQRYPESLPHYREALRIARSVHGDESYEALHCADVLGSLGDYDEAGEMIAVAQKKVHGELVAQIHWVQANMLLSRGKALEALSLMNYEIGLGRVRTGTEELPQLRLSRAGAELQLGEIKKASNDLVVLTARAQSDHDDEMLHEAGLLQAQLYRRAGAPERGASLLEAACSYFANAQKKESLWRGLREQAAVYQEMRKSKESKASAQAGLDILREFEQTWPPSDYSSYSKRPDIHMALQELISHERN